MTMLRVLATGLLLVFAGSGHAQLLAEVALAPAIASQLFPPMSFPANSLRAQGAGTERMVARVPDAAAWTDWEVYTATGLVAALEPALVYDVERGLLMDGFFREEITNAQVGPERHTRVVFVEGSRRALLYLIRTDRELVWLVARNR